jgi:hypothetical protein
MNLDNAFDQLLEHQGALDIERERFEENLMTNHDQFEHWAIRFAKAHLEAFLVESWEVYERTITPAYTQAWEDKPTNSEFWNWNDDRV